MNERATTTGYDSWSSVNSGLPYPLYFYMYSRENFGDNSYSNSVPMSQCPTVQAVQYCPFIEWNDVHLVKIPYDKDRFGTDPLRPLPNYTPYVYRVTGLVRNEKELGYVLPYRNIDANPGKGKLRNWKNEAKLWQYPYRKIFISDGMNTPMELKTYLLKYEGAENKIMVKLNLSDRMSYGLYVKGYKGDDKGLYEAMVSGDSLELPCSSSAWNQWYATSKNQTATATKQMINNSWLSTKHTNEQLQTQALTLDTQIKMSASIKGFGMTEINRAESRQNMKMQQYALAEQSQQNVAMFSQIKKHAIESAVATSKDQATTPPTMLSMGSDFMYGFNNQNRKLKISTFDITEEVGRQLGDYFAMYGYMANKVMELKDIIRSRHYYNYIKTVNADVKSDHGVPKVFLDEINALFNNGTTFWHMEHDDVVMGDYTYDNYEVKRWG